MGHLLPLLLLSGALLCVCNCAVFKKASVAGELSHPECRLYRLPLSICFLLPFESIDSVIVDVMQQDNYVVFKFMALQVLFNDIVAKSW